MCQADVGPHLALSKEIRLIPPHSKNREGHMIPLTGELLALMERRFKHKLDWTSLVFHHNGHTIGNFRWAWSKATLKAGCSGKLFHALRRSSTRDQIRAGTHERVVMSLSGWKAGSIFDRYNITDLSDMERALQRTEAYRKSRLSDSEVT